MLRNYLLIALRNLLRNRISSLVNILGLAIGMAAFVLIIQYVRFELNYDDFHEKGDQIFRIQQDRYDKGKISTQWAAGCPAVGQALYENFDEVENFTRFQRLNGVFSYGDKKFREEEIYLADTSFFELFSFRMLSGDPQTALMNPMEMVVSQSTARKYFGDQDPIGESLRFNGGLEFKITGVFEDIPRNSHLKPEIVGSWATLIRFEGSAINTAWLRDGYYNYIQLHTAVNYKEFEAKIPSFVEAQVGPALEQYDGGVIYNLQPLRSIHLHSDFMMEAEPNGNARSVYALMVIAVFLVIIAWVNFINISGARSLERAREVGMRKVTGAYRSQLVVQFLMESVLVNLVAILLAVLLVNLLNSSFNMLTGVEQDYSFASNPGFWAGILLMFMAGAFLSGLYPALVLSSFKPATVFQGVSELKVGGIGIRRILVIFQFATSLLLLAGTLTVYTQISFMRNHDLGVDIDNVLVVLGPSINDSTYSETFNAFKSEIIRNPDIEKVTASITIPGRQPPWNAGGIRRISEGDQESKQYRIVGFDFDFVDFYDLNVIEGRNFSRDFGQNSGTVLFNEAAIELMGFKDNASAMNVPIFFWGDTFNIVGVLQNYHQEGLKTDPEPLIFRFFEDANGYYSLKVNPAKTTEVLAFVEEQWRQFFPLNPYEYFFLEDYYNEQYMNEMRFGKVFGVFAFLAIFIACMGLFGLSSYTTIQRTNEIGLRKVLGSTSGNAVLLLLRYFVIQVMIAVPIGLGLGYYIMHGWLQNFAYRVGIGWWFYLVPLFLVLLITILTVGSQVLKTANVNPANTLRHE
ncbi:MAG: ABC transporter permease [Bacteroidia bacterium]|nr:MAG: ABC transporter permease [Bacteroidia bacterium]